MCYISNGMYKEQSSHESCANFVLFYAVQPEHCATSISACNGICYLYCVFDSLAYIRMTVSIFSYSGILRHQSRIFASSHMAYNGICHLYRVLVRLAYFQATKYLNIFKYSGNLCRLPRICATSHTEYNGICHLCHVHNDARVSPGLREDLSSGILCNFVPLTAKFVVHRLWHLFAQAI